MIETRPSQQLAPAKTDLNLRFGVLPVLCPNVLVACSTQHTNTSVNHHSSTNAITCNYDDFRELTKRVHGDAGIKLFDEYHHNMWRGMSQTQDLKGFTFTYMPTSDSFRIEGLSTNAIDPRWIIFRFGDEKANLSLCPVMSTWVGGEWGEEIGVVDIPPLPGVIGPLILGR